MKAYLTQKLREVLSSMEGVPDEFQPEFETPANPEFGDLATNTALQLARVLEKSPRVIAEDLRRELTNVVDLDHIASIEVAGPGFLNFRFSDSYIAGKLADVLEAGRRYGRSRRGEGRQAIVEYVSANPTGPLTVGHGRNAVLGDTIANLLEWIGFDVTREYYFNDAGRQMRILGESVRARYQELLDPETPKKEIDAGNGQMVVVPASFPEDGYLGEYIIDIAKKLVDEYEGTLMNSQSVAPFKEAAEREIFADIERTMLRIGVRMDAYFNERSLYDSNEIWEVVDFLKERNMAYEKDGAVWFRTTEFGKDQDTVLVKSSGEPTYRLPDIAYHLNKLERGFDVVVDIFGADHVATYPDVINGVRAFGYDVSRIDVVMYQFVTLVKSGVPVKMSTRKATYVTLDQLMDEVGEDVTRFFFLMRSPNTHLEFDLDLAKEAREKNPVFYLQYAHARICSIVRKAEEMGFEFGEEAALELLSHETEIVLIKELLRFPEVIRTAAIEKEPHRVIGYLNDVATSFTKFYDHCRIIGEEPELATARMHLARATQIVLRNGLTVLGISAPEHM